MQPAKVWKPASAFIPGTSLRAQVERWEVVGGRVFVTFTDGLRVRSEETPASLRKIAVPA